MSLIFWIAVGTALAALILGLVLKARLNRQPVGQEYAEPRLTSSAAPSKSVSKGDVVERREIPIDSRPHLKPQGEEMTTPESRRSYGDADLRRSSRVEQAVPLVVLATNRRGETFQERTTASTVNLHGCRYSSRHDYAPDGWVTLQVTGTDGANSRPIRARVRSILAPQSYRELCQVGVELETPGNVWGLLVPPDDWKSILVPNGSNGTAASAASALDLSQSLNSFLEQQTPPTEHRAEVTVFPGPSTSAVTETFPVKDLPPTNTERVDAAGEQILQALQGKIQLTADQAVQAALSSQLEQAVKSALAKIDDSWKANVRQTEEFSAARLAEVQSLWEKELAVYRSRAEELSRRLEAVAANSQQALAESQRFLERFANESAPQLLTRLSESLVRANTDFEASASQISEQHLTQIVHGIQQAARDAHALLDQSIAEIRGLSSNQASNAPSTERVESLLHSFRAETFNRLEDRFSEFYRGVDQQLDFTRQRSDEISRRVDILASETSQARALHEQALAELRSLLSNANAGVPQEHLDSLLKSSREQIHSHLEWRLGEVSGHFEQRLGPLFNRLDEFARQLDKLSADTRDQFAEVKASAERTFGELQSLQPPAIEQAVGRAIKDFETAAARVFDRELVRLVQERQAVSREISLELEARASEARALLQKAANSTLEEFRSRLENQMDLILAEARERLNSSLSSLDAESRAACEARHRALEAEVARAAEQTTLQFRSGMKAFLYSSLVAAVSAVDEHAQTTLAGLAKEPGAQPHALEAGDSSGSSDPPAQKAASASE